MNSSFSFPDFFTLFSLVCCFFLWNILYLGNCYWIRINNFWFLLKFGPAFSYNLTFKRQFWFCISLWLVVSVDHPVCLGIMVGKNFNFPEKLGCELDGYHENKISCHIWPKLGPKFPSSLLVAWKSDSGITNLFNYCF